MGSEMCIRDRKNTVSGSESDDGDDGSGGVGGIAALPSYAQFSFQLFPRDFCGVM